MRDWALAALVVVGSVLLPRAAAAGRCDAPLVNACVNADTLWPHAGPSRFVGVGSAETMERGQVGFALVTSYELKPIVLHVPSPGPTGTDLNAVRDLVDTSFAWAYGVTSKLEVGAVLPVTLGQSGSGVSGLTAGDELRDTAVRDLRFGVAYALMPRDRVDPSLAALAATRPNVYSVVARFEVSAPIGDSQQFAGEKGGVFVPSVAADYRRGRWFAGGELGARVRGTSEFVGARVGTQIAIGLGLGYDILERERLALMLEARALPTLAGQHDVPNGRHIVPAEWDLAARSAPFAGSDVAFTLAGGGGIPFSKDGTITTPVVRFTLGLAYQPRGYDSDGDGVLDRDDRCPATGGDRAHEGCPP